MITFCNNFFNFIHNFVFRNFFFHCFCSFGFNIMFIVYFVSERTERTKQLRQLNFNDYT